MQWITFHSCHRHMAHNALIFYAYFPLKQHNVHEQALLCGGWMSTSLLSHQLALPETLNHQTPVLLCELAFYSRAPQTCREPLSLLSPPLSHVVTPSLPPLFHSPLSCLSPSLSSAPFTSSPLFPSHLSVSFLPFSTLLSFSFPPLISSFFLMTLRAILDSVLSFSLKLPHLPLPCITLSSLCASHISSFYSPLCCSLSSSPKLGKTFFIWTWFSSQNLKHTLTILLSLSIFMLKISLNWNQGAHHK